MIDRKVSKVFRGIAILMVVASHYAAWLFGEPAMPELKAFVMTFGVYGVDIFLLLSGYGMARSAGKTGITGTFILKRFLNTALPYYVIVGFFAIMDRTWTGIADLGRFLIGYEYWFMCVIFALYIMFFICFKIGWHKEILLTICVTAFSIALWKGGANDFWYLSNMAFPIGVLASALEDKYGNKAETWIKKVNLIACGLVFTFIFSYIFNQDVYRHWPEVLRSISFTLAVLGLCVETYGGGVILAAIGRYSLYIYLIHVRMFSVVLDMDVTFGNDMRLTVFSMLITVVVGIALGYAFENTIQFFQRKLKHSDD
ncbi:MAG: acyltransferase [Lachnospiraceae bacterium]|nr:acyltransferase [Lachnospiraceae bacterium]